MTTLPVAMQQRASMSNKGFLPDSMKGMRKDAACRKFNIGAFSTPKAVKKLLSLSKAAPAAPNLHGMTPRRGSMTPRRGSTSMAITDLESSASLHSKPSSNGRIRRASLSSMSNHGQAQSQGQHAAEAPTPRQRNRRSLSGANGARGQTFLKRSLTCLDEPEEPLTYQRSAGFGMSSPQDQHRRIRSHRLPRPSQSSEPPVRRSSRSRNSPETPSSRSSRGSRPSPSGSRSSKHSTRSSHEPHQSRRRRASVEGRSSKPRPVVSSDLDESAGGISIDDTVGNAEPTADKEKGGSKSRAQRTKSLQKPTTSSRRNRAHSRGSAKSEDKGMSQSAQVGQQSSRRIRSKSSDPIAFCTPRRPNISKKLDPSTVAALELDDISVDSFVGTKQKKERKTAAKQQGGEALPKMDKLKKFRRSASDKNIVGLTKPQRLPGRSKSTGQPNAPRKVPFKAKRSKSRSSSDAVPKMDKMKRSEQSEECDLESSSRSNKDDKAVRKPRRKSDSTGSMTNSPVSLQKVAKASSSNEEGTKPKKTIPSDEAPTGTPKPRRKLPRRSKTHDGATLGKLKSSSRTDTPRNPAKPKSFRLPKSLKLDILDETEPSPIFESRVSSSKPKKAEHKMASQVVEEQSKLPPATIKIKMNEDGDETDDDTISVITSAPFHMALPEIWHCPCGYEAADASNCCGMCGTSRFWDCTKCPCKDNMSIFAFCAMCGDAKPKEAKAPTPSSPSSVAA